MTSQNTSFIFILVLIVMLLHSSLCLGDQDYVTITMPEKIIEQAVKNTLPMSLNPGRGMLEGSLVIDTIDRFELGKNIAFVHGLIIGRNLVLTARIGDQDLRLKLGEMHFPISGTFTFRFDPRDKNLYITPHLTDSLKEAPPELANKILPILALLNGREYPVSFESMKKIKTGIGRQQLEIEMEPVDILAVPGELVLKMLPIVSKTD